MTANFTLSGITKVQRELIIWAYERGGSFTWDEFKAAHFNIRTRGAVCYKGILKGNRTHDYLNPDFCREIREKLESWGVTLRPYAVDFGAWFDVHIGNPPPPLQSVTVESAPVDYAPDFDNPTPKYAQNVSDCPSCGGDPAHAPHCDMCDGRGHFVDDSFLFNPAVREAYFSEGGGGGYEIDDDTRAALQHATARANARLEFDHAKAALTDAQKAFNASRGWDLIASIEILKAAQTRFELAAAAVERLIGCGGGGGGDYAEMEAAIKEITAPSKFRTWSYPVAPIERFFESPRRRYEDGYRLARMMRGGEDTVNKARFMLSNYVRDRFANMGVQSGMDRPRYIRWCGFPEPYHWVTGKRSEYRFRRIQYDEIPF
jgi:hypothetical protein